MRIIAIYVPHLPAIVLLLAPRYFPPFGKVINEVMTSELVILRYTVSKSRRVKHDKVVTSPSSTEVQVSLFPDALHYIDTSIVYARNTTRWLAHNTHHCEHHIGMPTFPSRNGAFLLHGSCGMIIKSQQDMIAHSATLYDVLAQHVGTDSTSLCLEFAHHQRRA